MKDRRYIGIDINRSFLDTSMLHLAPHLPAAASGGQDG